MLWGVPWSWLQRMMADAPRYVSQEETATEIELQPQDAAAFADMMNKMIEENG